MNRDFSAAMREFEKALAVSPLFAEAHLAIAQTLRRQGQWQRALQAFQNAERLDPRNPQYAEEIFAPESNDAWWGPLYRLTLAIVCAWNGDTETALQECEKVLGTVHVRNTSPISTWSNVHAMRVHPAFAPLRGNPRFEAMLDDPKNNAPLF